MFYLQGLRDMYVFPIACEQDLDPGLSMFPKMCDKTHVNEIILSPDLNAENVYIGINKSHLSHLCLPSYVE